MHLPAHPNLDQLKNQAKDLLKACASGDPDALKRFHRAFRRADPQRCPVRVAREYGFAGWPALKAHVDSLTPDDPEKLDAGHRGRRRRRRPLDAQAIPFAPEADQRPDRLVRLAAVEQRPEHAMIDALVEAGADLNGKSTWWAGGFGVTHLTSPELAAYAVERGAELDIHAAARLGRVRPRPRADRARS